MPTTLVPQARDKKLGTPDSGNGRTIGRVWVIYPQNITEYYTGQAEVHLGNCEKSSNTYNMWIIFDAF